MVGGKRGVMNRPAIFFDRDNTLIANDGYLGDPGGVVLINGAARAIARARAMGFAVVTISNQSGVARGLFTEEAIHRVNNRMDELLLDQHPNARIDRHEFCPHHPEAVVERYKRDSNLRKPKPGMILQAANRLNLDLEQSWVIGDAPRDIEAGKAAGCRTILFLEPDLKPSAASEEEPTVAYDFLATSLQEAIDIIEQNKMSYVKPEPAPKPVEAAAAPPAEPVVQKETATTPTAVAAEASAGEAAPVEASGGEVAAVAVQASEAEGAAIEEPPASPAVVEELAAAPAVVEEKAVPAQAPAEEPADAIAVTEPPATAAVEVAITAAPIAESVTPTATNQSPIPQSAIETVEAAGDKSAEVEKSEEPEAIVANPKEAEIKPVEPEAASEPPAAAEAPAAAPAAPPRKMTFAERVRAGTFQPARSATAVAGAASAPERPKRAIPGAASPVRAPAVADSSPGESHPVPAAPGVFAVEPGVKPTEPISDNELLEPLLQQILEEVRLMRQQHPGTEFAVTKLLAGIVQVLVLPALFFAYLNRGVAGDLQSMLLLATFLQTLTIALLIMGRQQ